VKKPKTKNKSKLLSAPASRNITHKVSDRLKVSRSERGVRGMGLAAFQMYFRSRHKGDGSNRRSETLAGKP
jgi:hypothetical protein